MSTVSPPRMDARILLTHDARLGRTGFGNFSASVVHPRDSNSRRSQGNQAFSGHPFHP